MAKNTRLLNYLKEKAAPLAGEEPAVYANMLPIRQAAFIGDLQRFCETLNSGQLTGISAELAAIFPVTGHHPFCNAPLGLSLRILQKSWTAQKLFNALMELAEADTRPEKSGFVDAYATAILYESIPTV